jgi:Formate hydrogenlyase subunit 6/NADH:ubiquinone oxidoreductase 23 kD subunit (chain I)
MYPIVKNEVFEATRGQIANDMSLCNFCTLCEKHCPTGAIMVNREEKTWTIDFLSCITCNYCLEGCAKKSLSMEYAYTNPVSSAEKANTVITLQRPVSAEKSKQDFSKY